MDIASFLQALGEPTRLRLLARIRREGECCVCRLAALTGGHPSRVSRHLALLARAGVVRARREAQWVYYRLTGDLPPERERILHLTLDEFEREWKSGEQAA